MSLSERLDALERAVFSLFEVELGDKPGHDFRGNQYRAAQDLKDAGFDVAKVTDSGQIHLKEIAAETPAQHFEKTMNAAVTLQDKGYRTRIAPHGEHHHIEVFSASQEFGDLPGHDFHGNQYTYEVDYAKDHEAMQRGEYQTSKVKVLASNKAEADVLAAQMVGHRGIPTATRHLSTRMDVTAASHGQESTIKEGDVVVRAPHDKRLEGATLHSSEEAMGASKLSYTDKWGYNKTSHYPGGEHYEVERPASPTVDLTHIRDAARAEENAAAHARYAKSHG